MIPKDIAEKQLEVDNDPELRKLEEEIAASEQKAAKPTVSEPAPQPPVNNDPEPAAPAPSEPEKPVEKTPIDASLRTKLNIPDKFATLEDYAAWAGEAEKQKSKAEFEKDELSKSIAKLEGMIEGMKSGRPPEEAKPKDMTDDERAELDAQFHESPTRYLEKVEELREKKRQELLSREREATENQKLEQARQEALARVQKEEEELKLYFGHDKWDKEIRPELVKIYNERPYLQTLEDCLAVYERRMAVQKQTHEKSLKEETERKTHEKREAAAVSGRGVSAAGGQGGGNVVDKIFGATTIEELDAIVIPRE